jgi:hypothetical protein
MLWHTDGLRFFLGFLYSLIYYYLIEVSFSKPVRKPAVIKSLRKRSEPDSINFVRHFDRFHALAQIRYERELGSEELRELVSLRTSLRNQLARWLEKR